MPNFLALIPARAGSSRVKLKNIRRLAGHPLIAYSIQSALDSGVFERVVVTTDSPEIAEIARYYGADVPFLRPQELATTTSPDIEWLNHTFEHLGRNYDVFSILRPTSPFRGVETLRRARDQFLTAEGIDSIRAVQLCHEHPGKMWVVTGDRMEPLLDQSKLEVPYHDRQYQDCPKVYIQDSSLEIAWSRVLWETHTRGGRVQAPFFTSETEGFSVDYEQDWFRAEHWMQTGQAVLPTIDRPAYQPDPAMVGAD